MIEDLLQHKGQGRQPKLSLSVGPVRVVVYNKRSVSACLFVLLLATLKYLYLGDHFPLLMWFECCLFVPSMLCMLWVCFSQSYYISHRTEDVPPVDEDEIKHDIYCRRCMTFKMEKPKHCLDCDSCVIGWQHHCTLLGVCIDNNKYYPFGFLMGSWGVFAMCTYWMLYMYSRQIIALMQELQQQQPH